MSRELREPEALFRVRLLENEAESTLSSVMARDLDFTGRVSSHAHNTHAFAAKFPPSLPRLFIDELTQPGSAILDPMAGSGTALVEGMLASRHCIGVDLDPLAVRINMAKTHRYDLDALQLLLEAIEDHSRLLSAEQPPDTYGPWIEKRTPKTSEFIRYWFLPNTANELWALAHSIQRLTQGPERTWFEVILSSIIVTKSGGVSLARDLAHSRPHKVADKRIRNAIGFFVEKARKALLSVATISEAQGTAQVIHGDSRVLPLKSESVDLVVTSPPYANALDYMRAHKFSLVWLGHTIEELSSHRRKYIGAEWGGQSCSVPRSKTATETLRDVSKYEPAKARIIARYFVEMGQSIREMHRVLRPNHSCIIVVGSSTVRGNLIPTPFALAELAEVAGFKVVSLKEREIDRNRRLMPISRTSAREGIEARMHSEHVIALVKPAK